MDLPILDPKNHEEQPYYPPQSYECIPENNKVQEDDYFIDETVGTPTDNKWKKCCRRKIIRKNINSYIIKEFNLVKYLIIQLIIMAILTPVLLLLLTPEIILINIILAIFYFLLLCFFSLFLGYKVFHLIYLDIESNSIILTKKAMFNTKIIVYNYGELERAEICYKYIADSDGNDHTFKLYFVRKTGEKEEFHSFVVPNLNVNLKGIIYFIDLVNEHIQKNMN